jgi:hypothetical protein
MSDFGTVQGYQAKSATIGEFCPIGGEQPAYPEFAKVLDTQYLGFRRHRKKKESTSGFCLAWSLQISHLYAMSSLEITTGSESV